jgi:hypothetical protein
MKRVIKDVLPTKVMNQLLSLSKMLVQGYLHTALFAQEDKSEVCQYASCHCVAAVYSLELLEWVGIS